MAGRRLREVGNRFTVKEFATLKGKPTRNWDRPADSLSVVNLLYAITPLSARCPDPGTTAQSGFGTVAALLRPPLWRRGHRERRSGGP